MSPQPIIAGLTRCRGLLLCLALSAHAAGDTFNPQWGDPRLISEGEILVSDAPLPPADDAPWRPVALPDMWDISRPDSTTHRAWYRFPVERPGVAELPLGIYLWRYSMNARVYFNHELLIDGGSFKDPAARNIHRPLLALVPESAWRPADNWIYVNLRVYPGYGYLLPIGVGAHEDLLPAYEERYFYQIALSQYLFVVTLLVAVLGVFLWAMDRHHSAYAYFTAACLCWLVYCLNPFVQTVPISMKFWLWLLHSTVDALPVMLMLFIHRILDYRAVVLEGAALVYVGAVSIYYAFAPIDVIGDHSTYLHVLSMMLIAYLIGFNLIMYLHRHRSDALLFLAAMVVIAALAAHDLLMISGILDDLWRTHFLASHLGTPIMFLVMVGYLMWRLHANNVLLREQVAQATTDLESSFREREDLERQRAASAERERIYRDLHDDVGARLLSMVYRAESDEQAAMAREALRDMRTLVAQTESGHGSLGEAAAAWHVECSRRCQDAGCELHWDVEGASAAMNPHVGYHLTRVIRELLSNAIRHGAARHVRVTIHSDGQNLTLEFTDDGRGLTALEERPADAGRGIAGIEKRLSDLGGHARWRANEQGTRVTVHIPRIGGWPEVHN